MTFNSLALKNCRHPPNPLFLSRALFFFVCRCLFFFTTVAEKNLLIALSDCGWDRLTVMS